MNAIILAAGEGKRLRPLTDNKPKCLVELFDKSLLERQINIFNECGINDITVVTGFKNEMINFPNLHTFHNSNFNTTNMVETLFCAQEKLHESTIISYGDIIFEKSVLEKLINSKYPISVIIDLAWREYWDMRFNNPLDDAETLKITNGFITEIGQKPKDFTEIQGQYIGLMKFQDEGIAKLKEYYSKSKETAKAGTNPLNPSTKFEQSYMTDLLQGMINSGHQLKAIMIEHGWLELDSINDFELYNNLERSNKLSKFIKLIKN